MLPKQKRIPRHLFPKNIFSGTTCQTPHLRVHFFGRATRNISQYAVVASKKNIKSSVGRHTARRRVYNAIRSIEKKRESTTISGYYVIYLKKDIQTLLFADLMEELIQSFEIVAQKQPQLD